MALRVRLPAVHLASCVPSAGRSPSRGAAHMRGLRAVPSGTGGHCAPASHAAPRMRGLPPRHQLTAPRPMRACQATTTAVEGQATGSSNSKHAPAAGCACARVCAYAQGLVPVPKGALGPCACARGHVPSPRAVCLRPGGARGSVPAPGALAGSVADLQALRGLQHHGGHLLHRRHQLQRLGVAGGTKQQQAPQHLPGRASRGHWWLWA